MGEQLKKEILLRNGILSAEESKEKPAVIICHRCALVNQYENAFCSKCSYPLKLDAYDEIKTAEDKRMKIWEENQKQKDEQIKTLIEKQEKFEQLIQSIIDSGQLKPKK
jgi:hypothetical protein